jgi:hypothetical protein
MHHGVELPSTCEVLAHIPSYGLITKYPLSKHDKIIIITFYKLKNYA